MKVRKVYKQTDLTNKGVFYEYGKAKLFEEHYICPIWHILFRAACLAEI